MKKGIWLGLVILMNVFRMEAQVDPVLSGMILGYTEKAKKQLKSQERAMMLETTGHIWLSTEVENTTEVQKVYNDYLDSFRDIVCYAAQIYGFYVEVDRLLDNMGEMSRILQKHPEGAFAVALSTRRNAIYRELLLNSVDIVNDIRQVCLNQVKMTEKQRIDIVFHIRPKLVRMNRQLKRLSKVVKYTSFGDVWAEVELLQKKKPDKLEITRSCMQRWKRNGKKGF